MNFEKSCGAVVFVEENSSVRYLLMCSMEGVYGFPKGHMEGNETEIETALREVREETGIELEPSAGKFLFRYSGVSFHCDVWLFRQDFELSEVRLLEGETCAAMAADKAKILELLERDEFVRYEYVEEFIRGM